MSHESYITIKRDGQTTKYSKSKSLLKLPIGFLYNRYSYLLRQGKYLYTFYIQLKKVARGENPSYMLYFYTMIVNSSIIIFSGYASLTGQQKIKQRNPKKFQYLYRTNWLFADKTGLSIIFME